MKKRVILIISIILIVLVDSVLIFYSVKKKKEPNNSEVTNIKETNTVIETEEEETLTSEIINDLTYEFDKKVYIKDIIKKDTDELLDTTVLGNQTKTITIDNTLYTINYVVKDTKKPLILGGTTKSTTVGKKINLVNKFMCGDNHDSRPNCYIDGEYDINKVGTYNLTYVAIDSSGNKSTKAFKLKVKKESKSSGSSSSSTTTPKRTKIKTYINKYKTDKTKVGVDVSAWQDNINWEKAKKDGVEFAMIRLGYGPTSNNELKLDNCFKRNIKETKKYNIPRGIYFYSYANSKEEAIREVKYIVKELDKEKLELPIAFDWENWNSFNKYKVSFKELNDIANTFIEECEKNGYEGMLYSSAYYLNHIWKDYNKTWLAYYTSNNDFSKPFNMWQLTSSGKVNGIPGSVDIDILYNN